MAETRNTLLIRKGGVTKSTFDDFGFATGEIPFPGSFEIKGFAERDCPGEDGERVYFPDQSYIKGYDLKVEFKTQYNIYGIYDRYRAFVNYLTGRDGTGTEMEVYSPWYRVGRKGVYAKAIEESRFVRDDDNDSNSMIAIEVTFRITDPITDILLSV